VALSGPDLRNTTGKAGRVDVGVPDTEENNRTIQHMEEKNAERICTRGGAEEHSHAGKRIEWTDD